MTDLSEILKESNYPIAIGDIPPDTCFEEVKRFVANYIVEKNIEIFDLSFDEEFSASPGSLGRFSK